MKSSRAIRIFLFIVLISTSFVTYSATPYSDSSGILVTGNGSCLQVDVKNYYYILLFGGFLLPSLVISIMYALIFLVAHKRQKCCEMANWAKHLTILTSKPLLFVKIWKWFGCWWSSWKYLYFAGVLGLFRSLCLKTIQIGMICFPNL